jgi:hypothetical protein
MAIFLVRFRVFSVMSAVPALGRRPGERVATENCERDSVYMSHVGGAVVRRVATESDVRDSVDQSYVGGIHQRGNGRRGVPQSLMEPSAKSLCALRFDFHEIT